MEESVFVIQADNTHNLEVELRKLKERVQKSHPNWIITAIGAWQIDNSMGEPSSRVIVNFEKRL